MLLFKHHCCLPLYILSLSRSPPITFHLTMLHQHTLPSCSGWWACRQMMIPRLLKDLPHMVLNVLPQINPKVLENNQWHLTQPRLKSSTVRLTLQASWWYIYTFFSKCSTPVWPSKSLKFIKWVLYLILGSTKFGTLWVRCSFVSFCLCFLLSTLGWFKCVMVCLAGSYVMDHLEVPENQADKHCYRSTDDVRAVGNAHRSV